MSEIVRLYVVLLFVHQLVTDLLVDDVFELVPGFCHVYDQFVVARRLRSLNNETPVVFWYRDFIFRLVSVLLRYDNVVHALFRWGPGLLYSVEFYQTTLHVGHVHVVVIFMFVSGPVQSYFNRVMRLRFWRFLGIPWARRRRLCASEFGPGVRRT